MRVQLSKLWFRFKDSTAQSIARNLMKKGIPRESITARELMDLYSSLNRLNESPDFSSIKDILPSQAEVDTYQAHQVCAIIIETRDHPDLEFVVNNFIENTSLTVQIFHGLRNKDFILSSGLQKHVKNGNIRLTELQAERLSAKEYNALLLSKKFWDHVIGRNKIIVFQTDSIICNRSNYAIGAFTSYDYIGSKWHRKRPIGLIIDGGNGGLSLRDWQMTYSCFDRFPPEYWTGGEDGYFAFHIDLIGGKVGRGLECAKFSTQEEFLFNSWGAHKVSCLSKHDQTAFFKYCEEAVFMKV